MTSPPVRPWLAFAVAGTAIYLTILDLFIVNVAIESIGAEFDVSSAADLSWPLTIYAILFAAILVPAGRLGDRFGRRQMFLAGLALFLAGSLLAGLAPSYEFLLVGRAVQAVGAAIATPNSLGAVLPMFTPERRPTVLGVWGMIAASGAACGAPLGGVLAEADWRWIFLINLPIGIVALLIAPRFMTESEASDEKTRTDWAGAALLAGAIGALTLGLAQAETWGWDLRVLACALLALILGWMVALKSRSHPSPILEPDLFRRAGFGAGMLATAAFWGAFAALLLASSLHLTAVRGYGVLEAGLLLTPGPALSAVTSVMAVRIAGRVSPIWLAVAGSGALALGAALLGISLDNDSSYLTTFMPGSLLAGGGAGMAIPNLMALAMVGIPSARFSTGIAIYTVFRQIGSALGLSIWVAAIGAASLTAASSYQVGWLMITLLALTALGALVSVARRTRADDADPPVPPAVSTSRT